MKASELSKASDEILYELEAAHKDYEERKARLLDNLKTMKANLIGVIPYNYLDWIEEAIKFIKEGEM